MTSITDKSEGYRGDIDGLRAVAVLSVLFFHAGFETFSGGFVGVDVFFVISGFLITNNIMSDLRKGTFSFSNFYVRRARRLFPALFATLTVCFVAGLLLFMPQHMMQFGKSLVFAILSVSNFLFAQESGYFDTSADFKPLLHTWSLSVEEQFYLVWPSLLVVLFWFKREWAVIGAIVAGGVISLWAAEYLLSSAVVDVPFLGGIAARSEYVFYLAPFRVTEFAIGALMVWLVRYRPRNALFLEPLLVAGLILVVYPALAYSEGTVFPGLSALLPCLGTAMVIYGGTARYSGRLLNNRVAVGIGLISYSLYLVHWPIIVFYKYGTFQPLSAVEKFGIIAVSFVLATAMYHAVETPFRRAVRRPDHWRPRTFGLACAGLAVLLIAPSAAGWAGNGWTARFSGNPYASVDWERERRASWRLVEDIRERPLRTGGINVAIIGNSHAKDFFNALHLNAKGKRVSFKPYISLGACKKLSRDLAGKQACTFGHTYFFRHKDLPLIDTVVIAPRWSDKHIRALEGVIGRLKALGKTVILVGNTAEFADIPIAASIFFERGKSQPETLGALEATRKDLSDVNARIRRIAQRHGLRYFDRERMICPPSGCRFAGPDGQLLFFDYGHTTLGGAKLFGRLLIEEHRFLDLIPG